MSTFTVTVDCPRITFEDGKPVECGCEVEFECEESGKYFPATRWEPAEYPERDVLTIAPTTCDHGDEPVALTQVERVELERRAFVACDRYDMDAAAGWPCRCGDHCTC